LGCGSSETGPVEKPNKPPTVSLNFAKVAVALGTEVLLTVAVDDEDGDNVEVTWEVTRGLLNPSDQGTPTMHWSTPNQVGTDTFTITADDGNGGVTVITADIRVATPRGTGISGANTTWTPASSPYLLTASSLTVLDGETLTIQAGVDVIIDRPDGTVQIEGTLVTQGTANAPVTFGFNDKGPSAGAWPGIKVGIGGATPVASLSHTNISHARNGLEILRNSVVTLTNCKITFSTEPAIYQQGTGSLSVVDCFITNNESSGIQIEEGVLGLPSMIEIRGDSIAFNGDLFGAVQYTVEAAVAINMADTVASVPIVIEDNYIGINGFPGIRMTGGAFPSIQNNAIVGNMRGQPGTQYNIRLENGFNGPGASNYINATNNFWALTDSISIKERIRDWQDAPGMIETRVYITPWLPNAPWTGGL
jgi:hypothetical protein